MTGDVIAVFHHYCQAGQWPLGSAWQVHIAYVAPLAASLCCCMGRHAAAARRGACRGKGTLAATVGLAGGGWRKRQRQSADPACRPIVDVLLLTGTVYCPSQLLEGEAAPIAVPRVQRKDGTARCGGPDDQARHRHASRRA